MSTGERAVSLFHIPAEDRMVGEQNISKVVVVVKAIQANGAEGFPVRDGTLFNLAGLMAL